MNVMSVADARAGFSGLVSHFRADPAAAPVTIGSHRRPEVVVLSRRAYEALASAPTTGVSLARLRELRPLVERLAEFSRLSNLRVYGSVARGEETANSDIDLLVTPHPDATLFDLAQFELDMEALLGVPVSVMSDAALDPVRDAQIVREAVAL